MLIFLFNSFMSVILKFILCYLKQCFLCAYIALILIEHECVNSFFHISINMPKKNKAPKSLSLNHSPQL